MLEKGMLRFLVRADIVKIFASVSIYNKKFFTITIGLTFYLDIYLHKNNLFMKKHIMRDNKSNDILNKIWK